MFAFRGMYTVILISNVIPGYFHYKCYKKMLKHYPHAKKIEPFYIY